MFDINDPTTVYDFVKVQINEISNKVSQLNNDNTKIDVKSQKKTISTLYDMQKRVDKKLDEFKKNAEWKYFTIAFFGETNAGKSTLIESLRILLGEEERLNQQKKYNQLLSKLNINEDKFKSVQIQVKNIDKEISALTQQILGIKTKYTDLTRVLEEKKQSISLALEAENKVFIQKYSKKKQMMELKLPVFVNIVVTI